MPRTMKTDIERVAKVNSCPKSDFGNHLIMLTFIYWRWLIDLLRNKNLRCNLQFCAKNHKTSSAYTMCKLSHFSDF